MENDIYITKLPGDTQEDELCCFLNARLNSTRCGACVKSGKIQNTKIAFCSVGGHNVQEAIDKLQNADFKGSRIKVVRYVKTEKNRRFTEGPASSRDSMDSRPSVGDSVGDVSPATNGRAMPIMKSIGVVVHVVSVDEFYVQIQVDCQKLQIISSQMLLFDVGQRIKAVEMPVVGEIYAACYSADMKHYRAMILSEPNEGKIDVHFVDFGNKEVVEAKSIVDIEEDIRRVDFVARRCRFAGVKVADEEKAMEMLQVVAAGDKLIVHIYAETEGEDQFKEMLVDLVDEKEQSLRDSMIEAGALQLDPEARIQNAVGREAQDSPAGDTLLGSPKVGSDDTISPSATCIISHVDSAECFCIQGAYDKQVLPQIYDSLMHCDDYPSVCLADVNPNRLYCAQYSLDGRWYRCSVKWNLARKPVATFVDFGNAEILTGELKELPAETAALRPQALVCQLSELKILNPEMVKNELMKLANEEMVLKCQIQKEWDQSPALVDFSVENKFRSFCSWLIEKRWAERLYQRKSGTSPATHPPPQAPKWNRYVPSESKPKPVKKRETCLLPSPGAPKANRSDSDDASANVPSRQSVTPLMKHASNGDRANPLMEIVDEGIIREKILSELTDEIGNSYNLRFNLTNWRSLFGITSGAATGESLIERLEGFRRLKESAESGDAEEDSGDAGVHRKLIARRRSVQETRSAFLVKAEEVKQLVAGDRSDETAIMAAAEERDELAEALVQGFENCSSEFLSSIDAVNERVAQIKETFHQIDFVLDKCPAVSESESFEDFDNPGRELWADFLADDRLQRVVNATESQAARMEETRRSLSFITGAGGPEVAVNGQQSVKSFFPHLDDLNKAMKKELETYTSYFISGTSGKMSAGCLTLYRDCLTELLEELKELEADMSAGSALHETREFAKSVLSAKSALTDETIEDIENTSQKMKKARSQLRHNLADLEDLMESETEDSEQINEVRHSIDRIRMELHAILQTQLRQKKSITNSFKSRPELALHLIKLLKVSGPSICDTEAIFPWETTYFNLRHLNADKTLYESKYGEEDVLIKKMLVTDDGSRLRQQIADYQDVVSRAREHCLLPVIAAFVPPKESHVLYVITPSHESCDKPSDAATFLRLTSAYLRGMSCLHSNGLRAATSSVLDHLGKIRSDETVPEEKILLKPSVVLEAEESRITLANVIPQLRLLAKSVVNFEMSEFENFFRDVNSMDEIEGALQRIDNFIDVTACEQKECESSASGFLSKSSSSMSVKEERVEEVTDT